MIEKIFVHFNNSQVKSNDHSHANVISKANVIPKVPLLLAQLHAPALALPTFGISLEMLLAR